MRLGAHQPTVGFSGVTLPQGSRENGAGESAQKAEVSPAYGWERTVMQVNEQSSENTKKSVYEGDIWMELSLSSHVTSLISLTCLIEEAKRLVVDLIWKSKETIRGCCDNLWRTMVYCPKTTSYNVNVTPLRDNETAKHDDTSPRPSYDWIKGVGVISPILALSFCHSSRPLIGIAGIFCKGQKSEDGLTTRWIQSKKFDSTVRWSCTCWKQESSWRTESEFSRLMAA